MARLDPAAGRRGRLPDRVLARPVACRAALGPRGRARVVRDRLRCFHLRPLAPQAAEPRRRAAPRRSCLWRHPPPSCGARRPPGRRRPRPRDRCLVGAASAPRRERGGQPDRRPPLAARRGTRPLRAALRRGGGAVRLRPRCRAAALRPRRRRLRFRRGRGAGTRLPHRRLDRPAGLHGQAAGAARSRLRRGPRRRAPVPPSRAGRLDRGHPIIGRQPRRGRNFRAAAAPGQAQEGRGQEERHQGAGRGAGR